MRSERKQVGGDHYEKLEIQPIEAIRAWSTPEMYEGHLVASAVAYLARYRDKGGVEDIKKAAHYLEWLVEHLEDEDDAQAVQEAKSFKKIEA